MNAVETTKAAWKHLWRACAESLNEAKSSPARFAAKIRIPISDLLQI